MNKIPLPLLLTNFDDDLLNENSLVPQMNSIVINIRNLILNKIWTKRKIDRFIGMAPNNMSAFYIFFYPITKNHYKAPHLVLRFLQSFTM